MVGVGGVLWVVLVVVATTLVAIGFAMLHLRWAAAVVILGLAFILVDHVIGALLDGEVSTAGAVTGSLMVVQLITLVLSLLVASRRGRASHVAAVVVLGIGAIVLVSGGLNAARTIGSEPRATVVRSWLNALANDPVDRGWSYLGSSVQLRTVRDAYLADAAAVDCSGFRYELETPRDYDGAWSVTVFVEAVSPLLPISSSTTRSYFPIASTTRHRASASGSRSRSSARRGGRGTRIRQAPGGHGHDQRLHVSQHHRGHGRRFMVGVSAEHRAGARVAGGDEVDVDIALDTAPREVTVPDDFAAALDAEPKARATFDGLSYSNRSWHVLQVNGARTDETRQRRIGKSVDMLREVCAR
ncbi:hypothetical protein BH24CHL10_BH24CHL10_05700 [soil metagenome]